MVLLMPNTLFKESGHIPKAIHIGNWNELIDMKSNRLKDIKEIKKSGMNCLKFLIRMI